MIGRQIGDHSPSAAETPLGLAHGKAQRDSLATNRAKILTALLDDAEPDAPPTEEEILGLILGEMAYMQMHGNRAVPPPERKSASWR